MVAVFIPGIESQRPTLTSGIEGRLGRLVSGVWNGEGAAAIAAGPCEIGRADNQAATQRGVPELLRRVTGPQKRLS